MVPYLVLVTVSITAAAASLVTEVIVLALSAVSTNGSGWTKRLTTHSV